MKKRLMILAAIGVLGASSFVFASPAEKAPAYNIYNTISDNQGHCYETGSVRPTEGRGCGSGGGRGMGRGMGHGMGRR